MDPQQATGLERDPGVFSIDTENLWPTSSVVRPDEFKAETIRLNLLNGPLAIIFVRHGRSAANEREAVNDLSEDFAALKSNFNKLKNHDLPCVDLGHHQSFLGGRFLGHLIHTGVLPAIDRTTYSPFLRTKETLIGIFEGIRHYAVERGISIDSLVNVTAPVEISPMVGERFWGDFNSQPRDVQKEAYKARGSDPYYWTPGSNGERMANVVDRARSFLAKTHRPQYAGKVILVTTHGELMNGVEAACHELDPFGKAFEESFNKGIPNCGIYVFSRVPFAPHMQHPTLCGMQGMDYFMKTVPYVLEGADAGNYAAWGGEPTWQQRVSTRSNFNDFASSVVVKPASSRLAEQLKRAGVGVEKARAREF